ncbi:MAG TPA: AMIN domain-containing protein [Geomobilimonas sp.]|nr:AMIN domain-containing protein [Geomobilimonas sp.]
MGHVRTVCTAILLFILSLAAVQSASAAGILKEIKTGGGASPRVEFVTDRQPGEVSCYTMPQLRRAMVDLYDIEPGQMAPVVPADTSLIKRVTVERRTINGRVLSRAIIDLARDAEISVAPHPVEKTRVFAMLKPLPVASSSVPAKESKKAVAPPTVTPPTPRTGTTPAAKAPDKPPVKTPLQPVVPAFGPPPVVSGVGTSTESIEIVAQTAIERFTTFTLTDPGRLVIDIAPGGSSLAVKEVAINRFGVRKLRVGTHPDKVRLVLDADRATFPVHALQRVGSGLKIVFGSATPGGRK